MITTVFSGRNCPCYKCPDRYPACCDKCQKETYLAYKAEKEKIRENRRAYNGPIWAKKEGYIRSRK